MHNWAYAAMSKSTNIQIMKKTQKTTKKYPKNRVILQHVHICTQKCTIKFAIPF